jgi:hypothetical protein
MRIHDSCASPFSALIALDGIISELILFRFKKSKIMSGLTSLVLKTEGEVSAV